MNESRKLTRGRDTMIAGVCSGVAEYTGADPTVIRLIAVVGTILGFGSLILVYLAAWLILPPAPTIGPDAPPSDPGQQPPSM